MAKHFEKDIDELTLEALIKLEQKRPEQEEQEDGVPRRKGPSLASILGTMPSAATLGLSDSISRCIGEEKENGECSWIFTVLFSALPFFGFAIFLQNNPISYHFSRNEIN